jgi:DNA-binding response OmpR family regulator
VKILLVEDNERVSQFVVKGLQEAGHTTDHAANGRDGMFLAASEPYDVIIMDRMLPGDIDGLAIVEVLRKTGKRTPILILSALSEVDDRIRGLRSGGDDYLTKPFAFGELLARLDALHRRAQGIDHEHPLTVGDLHMDPLTRKVTVETGPFHAAARIQAAGVPHAPRRPGGDAHHALGERLGLSFRSPDQCRGRAYQQAAPKDRCRVRTPAAAHRAQRRLLGDRG